MKTKEHMKGKKVKSHNLNPQQFHYQLKFRIKVQKNEQKRVKKAKKNVVGGKINLKMFK